MENKKWINNKGNLSYSEIPQVSDKLAKGIYELKQTMFGFHLEFVSEKFEMPEKIFNSEEALIKRVIKTFNGFNKNFGILLKGLKGTGKTITAKQICEELGLPVILVNTHYQDMGTFINSIDQDVILFFDEIEKTYNFSMYSDNEEEMSGKSASIANLLTLMDGVFTSKNKRLFLLTTNKDYLPDALLSRPSRIRYAKDFTDLDFESIMAVLNDTVQDKKLIAPIVELLKGLEIVTIDIVKAFAEEANLYGEVSEEFFSVFNVKRLQITKGFFKEDGTMFCSNFSHRVIRGNSFVGEDGLIYYITDILGSGQIKALPESIYYSGSDKDKEKEKILLTHKKYQQVHSSFDVQNSLVI